MSRYSLSLRAVLPALSRSPRAAASVSIPTLRIPINSTCTIVERRATTVSLTAAAVRRRRRRRHRRRAKDAAAAVSTARDANYHVSMTTDCVLVVAAVVVTRLVSSQLARKQVNGSRGQPGRAAQAADPPQ